MSAFDIASLPADVAKALRALPLLTERLDEIARATSEMAGMREGIDRVGRDTEVLGSVQGDVARLADRLDDGLPAIGASVDAVSKDTGHLRDVQRALAGIDGRMATIEEAMPVLVEVQQHLAKLPEAIETLGVGIERLAGLMDRLLVSMDGLDRNVASLQVSIEPVGRLADKLPGSSPKS